MNQVPEKSKYEQTGVRIAIATSLFLLPAVHFLFDFLFFLIPALVFYFLRRYGWRSGGRALGLGILIALIISIGTQTASPVMLALLFVPAGLAVALATNRGDSPALAGLKGFAALACTAITAAVIVGTSEGKQLYPLLLLSLDNSIDEALKVYQHNEALSADASYLLAQSLTQIKAWIPRVLPASLISLGIMIIWVTLVVGNRLLHQHTGQAPWPEYRFWQLPEKLVWGVIMAAFLILLPLPVARDTGLSLLIVASVLYFFQGLAIVLFFIEKWNIPLLMRSLLLVIFLFQSVGSFFLSLIGLADTWFDFRHRYGSPPDHSHRQKKQ